MGLKYNTSKKYSENGRNYLINVEIRLNDECKNKICEFAVTGEVYEEVPYEEYMKPYNKGDRIIIGNKYFVHWCGGCCHDEIEKQLPEFKQFIDLHLINHYGHRSIENGMFWFKEKEDDKAKNTLSITDEEAQVLKPISLIEDKLYFQYKLMKMGIIDRWSQQANGAIAELERLCGQKFVNPYTPEEERFVLKPLTGEQIKDIEEKEKNGYYTEDAIHKRYEEKIRLKKEKEKEEIISDYNKKISKLKINLKIDLLLFEKGFKKIQYIYYDHRNEIVFNWANFSDKVSQEEFIDFINSLTEDDYKQLPKGIEFKIE